MERPRPPMMTAPDRSKPSVISPTPRIPVSLKQQAEAVVIQRARELVTRHPDLPDFESLKESIRVMDQLKGN